MRKTETVVIPAGAAEIFPYVARLEAYPAWLPLVHAASLAVEHPEPAWLVEVRARVGPFARSKQLRMCRSRLEHNRVAEFERAETDGRDHARWALRSELVDLDDGTTLVTMHLAYDGSLWTDAVLDKVLDEEVRRGRVGLLELFAGATPVSDDSTR